jgi:hypothetical protein
VKELNHPLSTTKYTKVLHDDRLEFNAPHHFLVVKAEAEIKENCYPEGKDWLGQVYFQKGPIKEYGVNGVMNEDLIAMVITRLDHFQQTEFACYENDLAIVKLEEALLWLRKRTMGREQRGVEGTHVR